MLLPTKRKKPCVLSFEEDETPLPIKKFVKNPEVFDQNSEESKIIEEIRRNYEKEQETEGLELIEISFAYWDGTNLKRTLRVPKSSSISEFMHKAKKVLALDFPHLESSSNLMFVKEDLIIPLDYTFLDLLKSNTKGMKGGIFKLEKHEDCWVDTGYLGKILERKWYEKNKHIFPASKWKLFEPD